MNKDLPDNEVKNVTVVIQPGNEDEHWSVHLINSNSFPIKNILVASEGYGEMSENREKTTVKKRRREWRNMLLSMPETC